MSDYDPEQQAEEAFRRLQERTAGWTAREFIDEQVRRDMVAAACEAYCAGRREAQAELDRLREVERVQHEKISEWTARGLRLEGRLKRVLAKLRELGQEVV